MNGERKPLSMKWAAIGGLLGAAAILAFYYTLRYFTGG